MKRISLAAAALGLALMLVCPESTAQNRRTSGTTSQPASTSTQTRQTTTGTRQTTTASQPTTTTTAPGGRRNSTTTTTTKTTAPATATGTSTDTKQPVQPQQKPAQLSAQQPANNGGTTMRPGGSTTHQNSNGNVTKPNGKAPTTGQPQNHKPAPKPDQHMTKGGKPVTPGYRPEALKVKPPKQPAFHNNRKPAPPKPFFDLGYHMYGIRVTTLPKGHTIRYVNKVKYYYYNGVFYRSNNLSGYIVSRPPRGYSFDWNSINFCPIPVLIDPYRDQATRIAEAASLAHLYASYYPSYKVLDESYYINNVLSSTAHQFYHNDGSYFIESGGRFSVVDAPLGAVIDRLPYDYEEIYLGNDLFYLVDNVLYGVICPEGTPYFEVFCVL